MKSKFIIRTCLPLQILALVFLLPVAAGAQAKSFGGKYQGTIKSPNGDVQVTLELKDDNGKISGRATTPHGAYEVVKATLADVRQEDDKLVGNWWLGDQTGAFELMKAVAKDDLSGEWTAVADANGQNFPFTLVLKLDGDKLSGSSSSELGESAITEGTFKDGKLLFKLNGSSGVIAMVAVLQDGKLNGDYDFAGQMQGKWVAVKKQ